MDVDKHIVRKGLSVHQRQSLVREKSDYILRSGETHSYGKSCKQDERKLKTRRSVEFSSEAERCFPWWVDGQSHREFAGEPVATDEHQVLWEFSESEARSNHEDEVTEKPVTHKTATRKFVASSNSENSGYRKAGSRKWPHNLHMSLAVVPHMDTVFSMEREICDREPTDNMEDLDVNAAIWCMEKITDSCELCSQIPSRSLVILGTWVRQDKADGAWDKTAEQMMLNFAGTSHPIFRASSTLGSEEAKEKVRCPFTSTVAKKTSNCFSAQ